MRRWSAYTGRRVDFLMRALPVAPGAGTDTAVEAIRRWLAAGARHTGAHPPTPWHLARKAMILLQPEHRAGEVVWPPGSPGEGATR
jgi:hypothetical protein